MTSGTTAPEPTAKALESSPFPDAPRVLYAKNPLIEVVCQLRFPPLLRIDSEVPAGFQDRIRQTFPLFAEEASALLPELSPELSQLVKASLLGQASRRAWTFQSEDTKRRVTLTREFIALSTAEYERWEVFRNEFAAAFEALQAEYDPSHITRVGLRYQNLISRSKLGLDGVPWSALLRPEVAAEYASPELASAVQEANHRVLVGLSQSKGRVHLRHGTALLQEGAECGYMIDNDFFTDEKTGVSNAIDRLDLFNKESGRLFRWCITERLHEALGPTPVT